MIYWLLSKSNRYKPFVSARVQEFQDTYSNWQEEVKYVPSENNPADCLIKPLSIVKLEFWHRGQFCKFLELSEENWEKKANPKNIKTELMIGVVEEKVKSS